MFSGSLNEAFDICKVGWFVPSRGWHVAHGWYQSVVTSFHKYCFGKKNADTVS